MTLAWNLLFYIEDCMAIKWGSTVVTAVKWDSTVCSQVKWGNTVVFPDASGAAVYSYGSNVFGGDIGNVWNSNLHYPAYTSNFDTGGAYIHTGQPDGTNSDIALASTNISLTRQSRLYICAPPGNTDIWFKSTTKIRIICNLVFFIIKSGYEGKAQIEVGTITGTGGGPLSTYAVPGSDHSMGVGYDNRYTWTGGTYNLPNTWSANTNHKRYNICITAMGTYSRMTGTISSIELLT